MPLFYFKCPKCDLRFRTIRKTVEGEEVLCPDCEIPCERTPKAPTTRIVETLDNGIMVRKLERIADAEQIYKDRAREDKADLDREKKV